MYVCIYVHICIRTVKCNSFKIPFNPFVWLCKQRNRKPKKPRETQRKPAATEGLLKYEAKNEKKGRKKKPIRETLFFVCKKSEI